MLLEDMLSAAGVDYKISGQDRYEVTFCCPFCPERGHTPDEEYHFGLNVIKGLAHCHRCGWKRRGIMIIAREFAEVWNIKIPRGRVLDPVPTPVKRVVPEELVETGLPDGYERFTNTPDTIERRARGYLRQRRVSQLQIARHKIGYAATGDMSWRVIFPVIGQDNRYYGWVGRSFGNAKPKYLNSPGLKGLWNAQRYGKTAVVVEGIMDALRVERALMSTRDVVAVARLGSVITPAQLQLLKQYENIVIFPDQDEAGVKGCLELSARCDGMGIPVGVVVPERLTSRDPGDMEEADILDLLRGAKRYNADLGRRLRSVAAKSVL